MKTKRYEKYRIKLLNDLEEMASKVGKNLKLQGRHLIILATATSMIMAATVALTGCSTSGSPPKYTAEEWQSLKFRGRSGGRNSGNDGSGGD